MNKKELVEKVAEKAGISKKNTDAVIKATFDVITEALANKDSVQFVGFGTFEAIERSARTGLNPMTKEKVQIPASFSPKFRPSKTLKSAIQAPR